jgi:thioredoxin 1
MDLGDGSFNEAIARGVALVDFWAPWCGPCRMQAPVLHDLARRVGSQATIAKVNVDEAPEVTRRFGIQSIPTLILFKEGKVLRQFEGLQSATVLEQAILAAIAP